MQRRAFVSYAREDAAAVERLAAALRTLRCDVWRDEALAGGQAWWDVILEQVRGCDLFVCAVSPATLTSVACAAELDYAVRLGKPLLPVLVEPIPAELLPSALAVIQVVDFTDAAPDSGLHLAGALLGMPPAPALPTVLPDPPPAPISYLSSLAERARARDLSADEQLAMVVRLEEAWARPGERAVADQIAKMLLARDDLLHLVAVRLQRFLNAGDPTSEGRSTPPAAEARWSAQVVKSNKWERTFAVSHGDRTWVVQYLYRLEGKVFVDGRQVERLIGAEPAGFEAATHTWMVELPAPAPGAPAVEALIVIHETIRIRGAALLVDGQVLYREGTLA